MTKLNEMRMYTWNSQGLNFIEAEDESIEKVDYFQKGDSESESIKEIEELFSDYQYGVSELTNKENKKYRNFSIYRNIETDAKEELIELKLDKDNKTLVAGVDINAKEGTQSSFVVFAHGESEKDEELFLNASLRVNLEKDAEVKLVYVTDFKSSARVFTSLATILNENSHLDLSYVELGANYSVANIKNILLGDSSQVDQEGVYFKEGEEFLDILSTNEHYGEETISNTLYNGALKDKAHKNWKGVVDLVEGAKNSDGYIGDYSIMFSDEVVNRTAPILLNRELLVTGSHEASVGRLNKEMLFYIMSRGIDKRTAESMMLKAYFSKALDRIESEDLRERLAKRVDEIIENA